MSTPNKPDWAESILAELDAVPTSSDGTFLTQVDCLSSAHAMVVKAARARRMSTAAYMRRAAYAMAANDLGVPVTAVLERDPRVSRETGVVFQDPKGVRFGSWQILGLAGDPDD